MTGGYREINYYAHARGQIYGKKYRGNNFGYFCFDFLIIRLLFFSVQASVPPKWAIVNFRRRMYIKTHKPFSLHIKQRPQNKFLSIFPRDISE